MTCNLHLPGFHALRPALQLLNSPFCSCQLMQLSQLFQLFQLHVIVVSINAE